jgi:hypothetical protein
MLLRQKRIMKVTAQSTHICQVQKQQNQIQALVQDNIGGISMLDVMENPRMLEKQQIEARSKLLESHQVRGMEIEEQRNQLFLLESKMFTNGQARGELNKYRDFLSFASSKVGDRKLSSSDLDRSINDFHRRMDGGIQSCKLIMLIGFMVDSILAAIERKVESLGIMKDKSSVTLKNEIDKYERAREGEQYLLSSIQSSQTDALMWALRDKTLSSEIAKLETDKTDVQVKEQETEKELRDIRDEIKAEEERFFLVKETQSLEMKKAERLLAILLEETAAFEGTLQSDEAKYETEKTQLFDSIKQEGWKFQNDGAKAYRGCQNKETGQEVVG